jgi:hypothetical protein
MIAYSAGIWMSKVVAVHGMHMMRLSRQSGSCVPGTGCTVPPVSARSLYAANTFIRLVSARIL